MGPPLPWDLLMANLNAQTTCLEDVKHIKKLCNENHGPGHVASCPDCWANLITSMRKRYVDSSVEWFAGRKEFLEELDEMFNKTPKTDQEFSDIEYRIDDERKEWYRDAIKHIELERATKSPFEARSLQQRLNDESIPAEELVPELDGFLYHASAPNEDEFNNFIKRLGEATTPEERNEAYIDVFFRPESKPDDAARCQKYIDMIRNGTPVKEALDAMVREGQSSQGDQDHRKNLQTKLEELKRAKAAHDFAQSKRDKIRQEKAQAAPPDDEDLPPCLFCSKPPNGPSHWDCPICLALYEEYGIGKSPVIFCSRECHDQGYESHKVEHECSAGDNCIKLQDDDVEMVENHDGIGLCKECVDTLDTPSVYCSAKCYENEFQRHREDVHIPLREKAGIQNDDEKDLERDPDDPSRYRAKKIDDQFITVKVCLAAY